MLAKKQANRLRGLVARKVQTERALWALNSDTRNGCDFEHLRDKVLADRRSADKALFGFIQSMTEKTK